MGHNAGWLTLASGLGGGADVILIPEIPYSVTAIADAIALRKSGGSTFSIVAVAEGAVSSNLMSTIARIEEDGQPETSRRVKQAMKERKTTVEIARELEESTGLEARVTILGHVQRGGAPSPRDRVLATKLGAAATEAIEAGISGVMIASDGEGVRHVPIEDVAGKTHLVPSDHPWVASARALGVCMGDVE